MVRQKPRKRASNGRSGIGGKNLTEDGKRVMERGSAEGHPWAEVGKKEETKNKRRKTKGQWESIPPHPSLPELWGCLGDCLQGSGLEGAVRLGLEGQ